MANSFQQEQETPELEMLSELAENLVFRLRGCDDVMIRKTLQEVYREFCRETKCLTSDRIIEVEPGRLDYPLAPAFGGVVTDVRRAAIGTQRLNPGFDYSTHGTRPLVLHLSPRWVPHPQPQAPDGMTVPAAVPGETPPSVPLAERHIHLALVFARVVQEEIPALNESFDPKVHNSIRQVEDENFGESTVCEVYQKGYLMGEKLLRPAMVVTTTGGGPRPAPSED